MSKDILIGRGFGGGKSISKEDLIDLLVTIGKFLDSETLPLLDKFSKAVGKDDKIVSSLLFKSLKYRNDEAFIKDLTNLVKDYSKSLPAIRGKVRESLPELMLADTDNINVRVSLSLISTGVFLINSLPLILIYLSDKHYTNSLDLTDDMFSKTPREVTELITLILKGKKLDFSDVADTIGEYPDLDLGGTASNALPSSIISGFVKSNFKSLSKTVTSFIGESVSFLDNGKVPHGFVGNPIFHIRLLLTDLQVNRYDRLKNTKKLAEIKILELSARDEVENDPSLKRQIEFYRNKVEKLSTKLDVVLED